MRAFGVGSSSVPALRKPKTGETCTPPLATTVQATKGTDELSAGSGLVTSAKTLTPVGCGRGGCGGRRFRSSSMTIVSVAACVAELPAVCCRFCTPCWIATAAAICTGPEAVVCGCTGISDGPMPAFWIPTPARAAVCSVGCASAPPFWPGLLESWRFVASTSACDTRVGAGSVAAPGTIVTAKPGGG